MRGGQAWAEVRAQGRRAGLEQLRQSIQVAPAGAEPPPEDRLFRRQVPRPALVYVLTASGPSHSDRNLCEHLAEALMEMTGGVAQVGGRGTRGNRPVLYREPWLGSLRD